MCHVLDYFGFCYIWRMKMSKRGFVLAVVILCVCFFQGTPVRAAEMEVTPSPVPTQSPVPTPTSTPPAQKIIKRIDALSAVSTVTYGGQFDTSKITVQITYEDGTIEMAKPDWVSTVDTSRVGEQKITVRYAGKTAELALTVLPRQIEGLKRKNSTDSSVTITWNTREEVNSYIIYQGTSETGSFTRAGTTSKNEYTFSNMKPGTVLYVKVRGVSEVGTTGDSYTGVYSDVLAIAPKPAQVTGVKAVENARTQITLSWEAAKGATGYAVYYRLSTSESYVLAGYATDTSYQVEDLTAGKDYYFVVYAYAATEDNVGDGSVPALFGTAPSIPSITKVKGGDKRLKVYWKKGSGAATFRIYVSGDGTDNYKLMATITNRSCKIAAVDGLKNKRTYRVKVEAVRTVSGIEMTSVSTASSATTKKAKATSKKAKLYKTKAKFKKSAAWKKYKDFRQRVVYGKSYILPGLISTNVAGFSTTRMVPQSLTFAGQYLLISAYDYTKTQESVIYVMDKVTRKYKTTIVLPHTGHLGGLAYDGKNIWMTHGKKLECISYQTVKNAVKSGAAFVEIFDLLSVCTTPETVSYVSYYKGKLWAGAYSETAKKYMYGYTIHNKSSVPTLSRTNRILMPNRTQGVAFTSGGKMIVSRSCQTMKGRSGFMSRIDTYKPTWNLSKTSIKKNKRKTSIKVPPMNEGIAIRGSYTYVIYESPAFSECQAPMDRITAFKTKEIS